MCRIIFMGTPDFAVGSLKILVENDYQVVAVVTMPDKPAGRGHKVQFSPVKKYALENNIPVLQPEKLKDPAFLEYLKSYNADLQIVVAFRMLPEIVWNMPPMGTFNLHASLLPQYRGAAPINWAIINGEHKTGVTSFFLTHEIDTGRVILQQEVDILPMDDAGTLHDKLMITGAKLVKDTVDLIQSGEVNAVDQTAFMNASVILNPAPKIFKDTCRINWNDSAENIHNFVRGLSPYPTAWTEITFPDQKESVLLKVFATEIEPADQPGLIGTVVSDGKNYLKVAVKDGFVNILELQAPGKKRMDTASFLRGIR